MGPDNRSTKRQAPQFSPDKSAIEKLTGQYTEFILRGILFFALLIVLTIALFYYEKYAQTILTGLLTAFGSIGGFIAGKVKKNKK